MFLDKNLKKQTKIAEIWVRNEVYAGSHSNIVKLVVSTASQLRATAGTWCMNSDDCRGCLCACSGRWYWPCSVSKISQHLQHALGTLSCTWAVSLGHPSLLHSRCTVCSLSMCTTTHGSSHQFKPLMKISFAFLVLNQMWVFFLVALNRMNSRNEFVWLESSIKTVESNNFLNVKLT